MIIAEISEVQRIEAFKAWDEHSKTCPWAGGRKYAGAIGGVQSWIITNTSIGQLVSIVCTCGWDHLTNSEDL